MYLRNVYEDVPEFVLGKGVLLREGTDVTVIASGITVGIAYDAAALLEEKGISARVINLPSVKPIDGELVLKAAEETQAVLTCENHNTIGGLGSAVAEVLADAGAHVRLRRLGIQDVFGVTASLAYQLEKNGLTKEAVAAEAEILLSK